MELPSFPHDDLMDVMEMTSKMETFILTLMTENELDLAMSALIGASINCMLAQCKTLDEVMFYRNLFMQILDGSIRLAQIKGPEKPPAS